MNAYQLRADVPQLALVEGDIFVQSPFLERGYVLARDSARTLDIDIIKQFPNLHEKIDVEPEQIPELIELWRNTVEEQTLELQHARMELLEQKIHIDDQIRKINSTIERLSNLGM